MTDEAYSVSAEPSCPRPQPQFTTEAACFVGGGLGEIGQGPSSGPCPIMPCRRPNTVEVANTPKVRRMFAESTQPCRGSSSHFQTCGLGLPPGHYPDLQSTQNNGPYTLDFGLKSKGIFFGYFGGPGIANQGIHTGIVVIRLRSCAEWAQKYPWGATP